MAERKVVWLGEVAGWCDLKDETREERRERVTKMMIHDEGAYGMYTYKGLCYSSYKHFPVLHFICIHIIFIEHQN